MLSSLYSNRIYNSVNIIFVLVFLLTFMLSILKWNHHHNLYSAKSVVFDKMGCLRENVKEGDESKAWLCEKH